jgi:putative polyhydroxyalkanoate system protein
VAEIRIVREHTLGLAQARRLAFRWGQVAQQKLEMEITYDEGDTHDVLKFKRPGAHGELEVSGDRFGLHARLGLLLGVFRSKIESEIVKNLDELLAEEEPLKAFEQGLEKHEARKAAKHEHKKPAPKAPATRKGK